VNLDDLEQLFLLATYGIWGNFSVKKMKKIINANFHVLGLFMAKKHDLSEFFFRMSVAVERKTCGTPTASPLKARKLKFRLPESFGPTWCPKSWHLKSLGTQSKKIGIF
jgi:hypothetical protein